MFDRVSRYAIGVFAMAAFSWPALAEESPISFVSGPLQGAVAENVEHKEDTLAHSAFGAMTTDTAVFKAGGMIAYVDWSRLGGHYGWKDTDVVASLSDDVKDIFEATGFTILESDRMSVNGYLSRYRKIALTGIDRRCGVFAMTRRTHMITGFACAPSRQAFRVQDVMDGISIDGVIGP
ncbi:hypothetical protein [Inquilinus limosus]|uniref:Uncharacterized protein n=1 Tax=Inquilinus limosus TaxID=171674 RepID=A0A211YUU4_9PROT|nr:hypothetical protein [Inquilinus limosus]OWJ56746.1 hypothetical protein BWR60_34665 [Inquilinus limosus]